MGEFSISHLLIIAFILLVFFGPSRLPALGQSIGKAIKGFKQGLNEIDTEAKDVSNDGSRTLTAAQQEAAKQQNKAAQKQDGSQS